jgi:hypothetical protein
MFIGLSSRSPSHFTEFGLPDVHSTGAGMIMRADGRRRRDPRYFSYLAANRSLHRFAIQTRPGLRASPTADVPSRRASASGRTKPPRERSASAIVSEDRMPDTSSPIRASSKSTPAYTCTATCRSERSILRAWRFAHDRIAHIKGFERGRRDTESDPVGTASGLADDPGDAFHVTKFRNAQQAIGGRHLFRDWYRRHADVSRIGLVRCDSQCSSANLIRGSGCTLPGTHI